MPCHGSWASECAFTPLSLLFEKRKEKNHYYETSWLILSLHCRIVQETTACLKKKKLATVKVEMSLCIEQLKQNSVPRRNTPFLKKSDHLSVCRASDLLIGLHLTLQNIFTGPRPSSHQAISYVGPCTVCLDEISVKPMLVHPRQF